MFQIWVLQLHGSWYVKLSNNLLLNQYAYVFCSYIFILKKSSVLSTTIMDKLPLVFWQQLLLVISQLVLLVTSQLVREGVQ